MKWTEKIVKHRRLIGLLALGWLFLLSTDISKTISVSHQSEKEVHITYAVIRALSVWGWVALFIPVFWKISDYYPMRKETWLKYFPVHVLVSLLFMPVHAGLHRITMEWFYREGLTLASWAEQSVHIIIWLGLVSIFSYWLIVGVRHLKTYYDQYRRRELRNSHLEAELTNFKMKVLSMQLHPHFLFNTLHNVNTLIYEDADTAEGILIKLKGLLQHSFESSDKQEIVLAREIEFISQYLDIEKTRFSDRLQVDWYIDPETLNAYVPRFILQPLVENSIRHGISNKISPATIRIISRKIDNRLQLIVEDEGPGLDEDPSNLLNSVSIKREGMGLSNTSNRLENLYSDYRFELGRSSLGGLKVYIELPYCLQEYQSMKK